jgi:hypothetical protein
MLIAAWSAASAQNKEWQPTGVWPFINQKFLPATVYAGYLRPSKTIVPCNIHIGKQALWYSQNDTLMEAIPGTVLRVEFSNGDVYVPVGVNSIGLVVCEDTIDGKLGRLIEVTAPNQSAIDDKARSMLNHTSMLQGGSMGSLTSLIAGVADVNGGVQQEELPIPLSRTYYFLFNGEIFEANNKNILKRLTKERRSDYRKFTRSAEIISDNRSSMIKVWNEFFAKKK